MKYRQFIEDNFIIDAPSGELVPFIFNRVQRRYYGELAHDYRIEKKGISAPVREIVLKARREGFTSLILALFAADDILQNKPTETEVISYKDEATKQFRKRYKRFITSYFAKRWHLYDDKVIFAVDNGPELKLRHNGARFFCGTASARVGERGGTLQKLLFSEAAYYPDSDIMTAKEILEGTARQVDIKGGWVFTESTANGLGNHFADMWKLAQNKQSRYRARFYNWREFYTLDDYKIICSEFTDKDMIKQEYPDTSEEAFLSSSTAFVSGGALSQLVGADVKKKLYGWVELGGVNYIEQAEILKHYLMNLETDMPHDNFYAGIDVAKVKDKTVLTVLREEFSGLHRGGVQAIAIDSTGIGDFLPDWFEQNTRWYVIPVKITATQNDLMYRTLQAVIANRGTGIEIDSPEGKEFFEQMISLKMERKGGLMKVEAPENRHDDYADSWALAELAYVDINGLPISKERPRSVSVINELLDAIPKSELARESFE